MYDEHSKFILTFIFVITSSISLFSCSCNTVSFEDAVKYSDEIFIGKIVKAEEFNDGGYLNYEGEKEIIWSWRYYFEVKKKLKGNRNSRLLIFDEGTTCNFSFDIKKEKYLVYANRGKKGVMPAGSSSFGTRNFKTLSTWLCSRTTDNGYWVENKWYKSDLDKLDKIFPDEIRTIDFELIKFWLIKVISVLLVILLLFWEKRRLNPDCRLL